MIISLQYLCQSSLYVKKNLYFLQIYILYIYIFIKVSNYFQWFYIDYNITIYINARS